MKKHCNIIGVGLAAAMLAACTTIDEDIDTSLDDGQTAQPLLALSLGGGTAGTRLSDAVVQEEGTFAQFRGIDDLRLIPFRKPGGGDSPIEADDTPIGVTMVGETSIAPGTIDSENHSKYYKNVTLLTGTSAFLVYGKAKDDQVEGVSTKAWNGALNPVGLDLSMVATRPANISFQPVKIYTSSDTPAGATAITTWLNEIYTAAGGDWANIAILTGVKDKFIAMTAGSSRSVLPFVKDLYDNIKQGAGIAAVDAVINKIKEQVDITETAFDYKSNSTVKDYPASIGLPDGAAVIAWNTTDGNHFDVVLDKTNVGLINVTGLNKYAFPPALWYYTNSHIHTATAKINSDTELRNIFDYTTAVLDSWDGHSPNEQADERKTVLGQYYTSGTSNSFNHPTSGGTKLFTANSRVETNTTLVAVSKPLQYGVGRLEMTVKANDATLNDGADPVKAITVGTTSFPITGILIGSQYAVDYQFHPTTTDNNDNTDAVLYDGQFTGNAYMLSSDTPDARNTLSLETKENEKVIICVELQNNSNETFTGVSGQVIRPGCRFYLLGELDPTKAGTFTQPTGETLTRVFEQDRVTKVNFTVNTLANAYNVIPDFTNPTIKFSLGVSDWKVSTPTGRELK
ncbi:MAG: hypothetical protein IIZ97_10300 [Prevotella sp.]|nr:hypothetical protein [Prevotella sp.]